MFRTALVPVAFAEDDGLVLSLARGLGALGVRRVVLAHVVDASGMEAAVASHTVDEALDRLRRDGEAVASAGLSVEVRVSTGERVRELTAMATESQVDVVVCGSHAKSLMADALSGSVSARLLRDTSVPHLSVRYDLLRNQADPADLLRHFGDKVILPTDFSLSAARAFTCALGMSGSTLKNLCLLHAVDPALPATRARQARDGAEFHLRNLQAMCSESGLSSSACVRTDSPVHAALDEIGLRRATGVIVGTHGRSAAKEALLGSVSMTLLRQASCPVLIVP